MLKIFEMKLHIIIVWYIFQVTYQTELFLDKNKDYVVAEHQALLNASTCPFVSGLFPSLAEDSSKTSKFSSIGSRFKVFTTLSTDNNVLFYIVVLLLNSSSLSPFSNNCSNCLKFSVPRSHITFAVLSQIIFLSQRSLRTKMCYSNCAVG